jgi:hypothetical protein
MLYHHVFTPAELQWGDSTGLKAGKMLSHASRLTDTPEYPALMSDSSDEDDVTVAVTLRTLTATFCSMTSLTGMSLKGWYLASLTLCVTSGSELSSALVVQ